MITSYELSCGCFDSKEKDGLRRKIFREHGVYHVQVFVSDNGMRVEWNSFRLLARARKDFNRKRKLTDPEIQTSIQNIQLRGGG